MARLNVLICGGGCAGPSLAYWLARVGHRVTVVESFPALRAAGAQIDVRQQGLELAKRMGLYDAIRSVAVEEDGMAFVNSAGKIQATFRHQQAGRRTQNDSKHFEIMRGDLVRVLYDATRNNVEYMFGKTVQSFEQDDQSVTVHFSDGKTGTYDILVGADGQGSRIRKAILPPGTDPLRRLGVHIAFWRVPTVASDDKLARAYRLPGGRMVLSRTHSPTESQGGLMLRDSSEELRSIYRAPVEQQKEFFATKFKDGGWNTPRLLDGMRTSEYFYCQEVAQVLSNTWHKGRVVLVADAAHCPSPMTGMGTTSAFVGAYVLAGEITQNSDNLELAFQNYDRKLRPFVNEIQKLPSWIIRVLLPQTQFGINLLNFVAGVVEFLRIPKLMALLQGEERVNWKLPEYPLLDRPVMDT